MGIPRALLQPPQRGVEAGYVRLYCSQAFAVLFDDLRWRTAKEIRIGEFLFQLCGFLSCLCALAAEPRFILLDEPFAGVDPLSVLDIQRIIRELTQRGIGVLITDHNVRETLGVCARAYIVNQGTVIAAGTAEEVLANPQVREVYLGESFRL